MYFLNQEVYRLVTSENSQNSSFGFSDNILLKFFRLNHSNKFKCYQFALYKGPVGKIHMCVTFSLCALYLI